MRTIERYLSDCIVFVAFVAVIAIMLMTVGDIVLRLFSRLVGLAGGVRPTWGLQGLVDLTQLAIMAAVPLAIASAFICSKHIRINLLFDALPETWRRLASLLSSLVGVGVLGACLWTAIGEFRSQLDYPTTSATLNIPYTWYWAPLATGFALSLLACVASLIRSVVGVIRKPAAEDPGDGHV